MGLAHFSPSILHNTVSLNLSRNLQECQYAKGMDESQSWNFAPLKLDLKSSWQEKTWKIMD